MSSAGRSPSILYLCQTTSNEYASVTHNLADFWRSRYEKNGHTGWGSPVIYAYDQQERLALISDHLDSLFVDPPNVIDFGCGTGDFSRLMLEEGFRVYGYDPYVRPTITDPNFVYVTTLDDLRVSRTAGLILSVTVLDHILNDKELLETLVCLNELVSDKGHFLLLEYALDGEFESPNNYQAFRSLARWGNLLSSSGWEVSSIEPIPHPFSAPSLGFQRYRKAVAVRLLHKLISLQPNTQQPLRLLRRCAATAFDRYREEEAPIDNSPLKLMICSPAGRENLELG